ncbi:hypothetical protein F5141DRAFT_1059930 [Pisolithus sp. B1]|nr:hypothetical protein F5141DRAFT_1059930 [Pisolithus sp. B1]
MYKEARGNLELRNEILAEVKGKILEHEPLHSVELPHNLRVVRPLFIMLDRSENKEDTGEGENAREEKARATKAGDYKKVFTAFTAAQQVFKEEIDAYDRERRDTKDPKTIGKRTKIVQQWWESLSNDQKLEAGRAAEKYWRKNLPAMAKDLIVTVQRTLGPHVVMFVGHESGEGQIKLAVFETAPGDGKKVFTESSQSSKDWVLTAESILTDYLLTDSLEEDSAEKEEVGISLDEDGNLEVPTWVWDIAKFTKKPKVLNTVPKCRVGLEGDTTQLASACVLCPWTSPDVVGDAGGAESKLWGGLGLGLKPQVTWRLSATHTEPGTEWLSVQNEDKGMDWIIQGWTLVWSTHTPLLEDSHLLEECLPVVPGQFDRKVVGSSKKRGWVMVDDGSEAEVGGAVIPGPSVTQHSVGGPSEQTVDGGEVPSIVDLVDALPEQGHGKGTEAIGELQSARFSSSSRGLEVVLGLGLLLRECSHAQEVEEDDPLRDDVMDVVGVVVSRLEQCPAGTKEPQGGDGGAGMGKSDRGDEEKEKEEEEAPPKKRKRVGSGIVTRGQKMAKKDEGKGKKVGENQRKGLRTQNQTKRAM